MIILNSLFPVFSLLVLGGVLNHRRLTNTTFLKTSDKLIYFIFFPVMLFWKIGNATTGTQFQSNLYLAVISALGIVFLFSLLSLKLFHIGAYQAGSFNQACIRFNTYVGVAIIMNALGDEGIHYFGILIGFVIPLINVLVIIVLIWNSGKTYSLSERVTTSAKALVSNPLIIGCLSGIAYSNLVGNFPTFLDNTFALMSMITLPLALLSIGGTLTLKSLKQYSGISLLASILKLLILPLIGYGLLKLFRVDGIPFKTGMIFFALPTSTALYILSGQMNSDTELASAAIVLSTILSFFSLSVVLII